MSNPINDHFVLAFIHQRAPFHHRDHLHLAWQVTMQQDLATATKLITMGIRMFAVQHGQAEKYHETLTQFWVRIVAHMVHHRPDITEFETFLAAFPLLLEKDLPYRHWRRETMQSATARAQWVEPDVLSHPALAIGPTCAP